MGESDETVPTESFEELVEQTRGPREVIVSGLRFYGGNADAQQLRRYGEIGRAHV